MEASQPFQDIDRINFSYQLSGCQVTNYKFIETFWQSIKNSSFRNRFTHYILCILALTVGAYSGFISILILDCFHGSVVSSFLDHQNEYI